MVSVNVQLNELWWSEIRLSCVWFSLKSWMTSNFSFVKLALSTNFPASLLRDTSVPVTSKSGGGGGGSSGGGGDLQDSRQAGGLSESEQVSLEEFLESCRATQLLAELEDDEDDMPEEGDDEDDDDDDDVDDDDDDNEEDVEEDDLDEEDYDSSFDHQGFAPGVEV